MHRTQNRWGSAAASVFGSGRDRASRGFTLLDVLIAIGVVGILIAIMLPAIGTVQETTRRVTCGSNMRQLGLGIQLYANGNRDRVPSNTVEGNADALRGWEYDPIAEVVTLRRSENHPLAPNAWTGLGRLYKLKILEAPGVAYCPSHEGDLTLEAFEEAWRSGSGKVCGNFYLRDTSTPRRLSDAPSRTALLIDGFTGPNAFNHMEGANILRADGSVMWKADPSGALAQSFTPERVEASHSAQPEPSSGGDSHGSSPGNDPWRTLDLLGGKRRGR